jgi:hypothetical protein
MSKRSIKMTYFVVALVILGPIGVISGIFSIGFLWDSLSGCFFSLSRSCGSFQSFAAVIWGMIAAGSFIGIQRLWKNIE